MKSLLMTLGVVIAAIALSGCPDRQTQPVPGPKSATDTGAATSVHPDSGPLRAGGPDKSLT
jgi:hypothetical protein